MEPSHTHLVSYTAMLTFSSVFTSSNFPDSAFARNSKTKGASFEAGAIARE